MKTRKHLTYITRTLASVLIVLLCAAVGSAEAFAKKKKTKDNDDVVIVKLDSEPMFPGGDSVMFKWIDDNLRFPPSLQERHKRGVVVVSFIVRPDGSLSDLKLNKKFSDEANAEALRLVSTMPAWIPGTYNGHAVSVPMNIPIAFNAKMPERKEKESFATWLDQKIKNKKREKSETVAISEPQEPKQPYVPVAPVAAVAEPEPATGPVYFVDGVRFNGDPSTINLSEIESFSEIKKSEEFPNGCIYITLKKKK